MKIFGKFTCLILISVLAGFVTSCRVSSVYIHAYLPAEVNLGNNIDTLILVDRSAPPPKFGNIVEGILTGGGQFQDGSAAFEVLNGLYSGLSQSPRFNFRIAEERLDGGGLSAFLGKLPEPIEWKDVDIICAQYEGEALVALEAVFPKIDVRNYTKEVERKTKTGEKIIIIEHFAEEKITVDVLFRVYEPANKNVVDQHKFTHQMRWTAKGDSPSHAIERLINRQEAVFETSYAAGLTYARRIAPSPVSVLRHYYRKSQRDPYMRQAEEKVLSDDWVGAMEDWNFVYEMVNRKKTAGRAAYNMAVGYEVLGELDLAKEWANESFLTYKNKRAKRYVEILSSRIRNEEILQEQMSK